MIEKTHVYVQPRTSFVDSFLIDFGNLKLTNSLTKRKGRWRNHKDEEMFCSILTLTGEKVSLKFNNDYNISNEFNIFVEFEMPDIPASHFHIHNYKVLNQSLKITMDSSPINLFFKQIHYNFLMKCLDLNINYTDGCAKYFPFETTQKKQIHRGLK